MSTVVATYRVRADAQDELDTVLRAHWPLLDRLGLVTPTPALLLRRDTPDGPERLEIFSWKDEGAAAGAHDLPEVASLWDRIEGLCERRPAGPATSFPHFDAV